MTTLRQRPAFRISLAAFLVVTLSVSLVPLGGQSATAAPDYFSDDNGLPQEGYINAVAAAGLFRGCNPPRNTKFCPDRSVTRGEMATVLTRALGLKRSDRTVFEDSTRSVHRSAIGALAASGISRGCNPPRNTRFCPTHAVDRGEMAAFLTRGLNLPRGSSRFKDTSRSVFASDITAVVDAGFATLCGPRRSLRFCPGRSVSRAEAAEMLGRALGLTPLESDPTTTTTTLATTTAPPATSTTWAVPIPGTTTTSVADPTTTTTAPPASTTTTLDTPVTTIPSTTTSTTAVVSPPSTTSTTRPAPTTTLPPSTTTSTSTTTTTLPPTTTTTTLPPLSSGYPGRPAAGTIYWGAHIEGAGPEKHEGPAGAVMTLHRVFIPNWSSRTKGLVTKAREDVAAGRLPWVSIKTPSWASMAAGDHDGEIDEMLRALDGIGGPVWLTIHHEPEGGGGVNSPDDPAGAAGHLAMNRRIRQRMTALGTDNITLVLNLMGWTFNSKSGRNPDEWWDSSVYDLLSVNEYRKVEASLVAPEWLAARRFAAAEGVDIAVGEWGTRGTDAAAGEFVREWFEHGVNSHKDGQGARVVALAAFDSGENSPDGSWELKGAQLEAFRELFSDPRNANP